jgi:hypothetical protein
MIGAVKTRGVKEKVLVEELTKTCLKQSFKLVEDKTMDTNK